MIPSPVRRPSLSTRKPFARLRSIPSSRATRRARRSIPPLTIAVRTPRARSPSMSVAAPGMIGTRARMASRSSTERLGAWRCQMRTSVRMNSWSSIRPARKSRSPSALWSWKWWWTAAKELSTSTSVPSMSSATSLSTVAPGDRVRPVEDGVVGTDAPAGEVPVDLFRPAGADDRRGAVPLQPVERDGGERDPGLRGQGLQRPRPSQEVGQSVGLRLPLDEPLELRGRLLPVQVASVQEAPRERGVGLEEDPVRATVVLHGGGLVAVEQVVQHLVHDDLRFGEVARGFLELLEPEVRNSDGADAAVLPQRFEGRDRLGERDFCVRGVDEVEVDRRPSQPFEAVDEAGLHLGGPKVLPRDLGREEDVGGPARGAGEDVPQDPFGAAAAV